MLFGDENDLNNDLFQFEGPGTGCTSKSKNSPRGNYTNNHPLIID